MRGDRPVFCANLRVYGGELKCADMTPLKSFLISGTAFAALACGGGPAFAQGTPQTAAAGRDPTAATQPRRGCRAGRGGGNNVLVTGSRIRQDPNNSALPLQIINMQELQRNSISSPEQLLMFLPSNASGADNLASNSDVVSGAQRGTNGLSSANLRGQGNASTLLLLNNRRVAAHGLSGSAVDVNQIPYAAIERIEVLKDGASAIYGTDAIGGVINFITRTDYEGIGLSASPMSPSGDASIYRLSAHRRLWRPRRRRLQHHGRGFL